MRLVEIEAKSKKICIIGISNQPDGYYFQLDWILKYFQNQNYIDFVNQINNGEIDLFDMRTNPEKGDALDAIENHPEQYSAVVGVHLYGIGAKLQNLDQDYFYSKRNHELLKICQKLNIPLFILGDQPNGKGSSMFIRWV